jgi:hypothetical protein
MKRRKNNMGNERGSFSSPVNPLQGPVTKPGRAALHFSKQNKRAELRIFSSLRKKSGRVLWDMGFLCFLFVFFSGFMGKASWYDSNSVKREGTCHAEKCYTASGAEIHALEKRGLRFCASNDYPFGSRVKITNAKNQRSVEAVVYDRGGFEKHGRSVDLCLLAFSEIANPKQGVIRVKVEEVI